MRSEKELIESIRQRNADAFDELMQRYLSQVKTHLKRIVRDDAAADDLAQEVSLRVWQRVSQWNGKGAFVAWVMKIATNMALNHLRTIRRHRERPLTPTRSTVSDDDDSDAIAPNWMIDASTPGPDEAAAMNEQIELMHAMIDDLPDAKRRLIHMIHEQDMNLAQAAEELGIPVGTVKSRLHYTFRLLSEQWKNI